MKTKLLVCIIASICLIGLAIGVELTPFDWFKMYEETAINNTYLQYKIIDLQNQVQIAKDKPCNCGVNEKIVYIEPAKHFVLDFNRDGVVDANDYDIIDRCTLFPDDAICYA